MATVVSTSSGRRSRLSLPIAPKRHLLARRCDASAANSSLASVLGARHHITAQMWMVALLGTPVRVVERIAGQEEARNSRSGLTSWCRAASTVSRRAAWTVRGGRSLSYRRCLLQRNSVPSMSPDLRRDREPYCDQLDCGFAG